MAPHCVGWRRDSFIQNAPLGEFRARLDILMAFAVYLHNMHTHEQQQQQQQQEVDAEGATRNGVSKQMIECMLYNLWRHYRQFLPAVEAAKQGLAKKIVDDLQGFVKISRWDDVNYYALKDTAERSHRRLFKFSKVPSRRRMALAPLFC
jgi:midasin